MGCGVVLRIYGVETREGVRESGPKQGQGIYDSPQSPWTTVSVTQVFDSWPNNGHIPYSILGQVAVIFLFDSRSQSSNDYIYEDNCEDSGPEQGQS